MPEAAGRAVLVGGSLAGLCAALALAKDRWQVTVVERATGVPAGGAGLGIDRELLAQVSGVAVTGLPVVRGNRESTAWSLVQALLLSSVQRNPRVEVLAGTSVTGVSDPDDGRGANSDRALVHTDGGDVRADLVVGADGVSSVVRRFVAPDHPTATYAGYMLWRGLVEENQVPELSNRGDAVEVHTAPGARLVIYGVPGRDGRTAWGSRRISYGWYDANRTDLLRRTHCLTGDVVTGTLAADQIPAEVLEDLRVFASQYWPPPWDQVIQRSIHQVEVFGTPIAEYRPQQLVRGRVALIGDAAHVASPVTGAGFINGLLDVAALATAVRDAPAAAVPNRLTKYQLHRLKPVQQMVASSMAWSRAYTSGR